MAMLGVDFVSEKERLAVTYGRAYEFDKIFDAYMAVIVELADVFGGRSWVKPSKWIRTKAPRIPVDRGLLHLAWERITERYQVTDEHLVHVIGPLTLDANLLGTSSLVYDLRTSSLSRNTNTHRVGRVPGPDGEVELLALESHPEIFIHGARAHDGSMRGIAKVHMDKVKACMDGPLADLGLACEIMDAGKEGCIATIGFPFPRYRAKQGFQELSVRCVVRGSLDPEGAKA